KVLLRRINELLRSGKELLRGINELLQGGKELLRGVIELPRSGKQLFRSRIELLSGVPKTVLHFPQFPFALSEKVKCG
ncbi:MAG TPA: hypothetical protein PLC80_18040, partial [Draconibacterium sp.]|nr:hypothetical protein [Draconibacterium sp.]